MLQIETSAALAQPRQHALPADTDFTAVAAAVFAGWAALGCPFTAQRVAGALSRRDSTLDFLQDAITERNPELRSLALGEACGPRQLWPRLQRCLISPSQVSVLVGLTPSDRAVTAASQ